MPAYDYDCAACGRRFEVSHGVHADSPTTCPFCGKGPVRKAISAPAIHYKGSGWAKKERRATVTPGAVKTGTDTSSTTEGGSSAGESKEASTPAATKPADGGAATATD